MADLSPNSYVKVNVNLTADPNLEDWEFRCLVALESWAWQKDHCWPGNKELARRCGWVDAEGKWSRSKVKRALAGLEAKGYIRRVVTIVDGEYKRERILLSRAESGGSYMNQGGSLTDQGGSPVNQGVGHKRTTVVQDKTTGGSQMSHELDPGISKPKQTQASTSTTTSSSRTRLKRMEKARVGLHADQAERLRKLLSGITRMGPKADGIDGVIAQAASWMCLNLRGGYDDHIQALWGLAWGNITAEKLADDLAFTLAERSPR